MQKKIITRIFGGLGNQLFCYAAARRLALVNNAELVIDHISGFKYDYRYKRTYQLHHFNIPCRLAEPSERLEPFSRIRRAIKKRAAQFRPFHKRNYITQEEMVFDNRLLHLNPKKTLYLEGYWQSEKYFKDVEDVIRKDLSVTGVEDEKNLNMSVSIMYKNSVAVHVRFFGEAGNGRSVHTSLDYYQKAVEKIAGKIPNAHFFVFSDKPEAAEEVFSKLGQSFTLVNHNKSEETAYLDLWLMSQCNHFIIANSTFSWWGAWLSTNPQKIVIAPGFVKETGTGAWGFDGLLPDKWIKV